MEASDFLFVNTTSIIYVNIVFLVDMDSKSVFDDDMPSGLTPIVRTPSPYEFLPSYKLSEGHIYKSPIFIKNDETNSVPVINDVNNYSGEMPDSKKSTNGLFCHEDYMHNKEPPIEENIMQDLTNVVKSEPLEEKPTVINGANKQDSTLTKKSNKKPHKTKTDNTTHVATEQSPKHPPAPVEDNYQHHEEKSIVEPQQTNVNIQQSSSPRKARTRSESAVWDMGEKRQRRGVKRRNSVETGPQTPVKQPKIDYKSSSQVPSSKSKEHRSKDKHEHKEHKSSSSKSSHDRKRRLSIGIQARPSQDSGRHYLKLLEPRPCLLESGNLSYPPSDVRFFYFNCKIKTLRRAFNLSEAKKLQRPSFM